MNSVSTFINKTIQLFAIKKGSPNRFDKFSRIVKSFVFFACLPIFFLTNCANPIPPTGGPKDERPPQLDTLNSTRNMQIRFEKKDIVLAFDEWVELKDAFNQVVVSPPLEYRPTIERKKKTIQFKFDEREVLRDSATYVINFGEAIKDLTEGNVAPIVFVFSTGDYIDSLSTEGTIVDAYTNEPVKDVIFMLYENLADSVFRTERPFYFARTDEAGKFVVNNMKSGTFKATALIDNNLNYRFDSEAEKIAFLDSTITIKGIEKTKTDTTSIVGDSLKMDSTTMDSIRSNKTRNIPKDTLTDPPITIDTLPPLIDSLQNDTLIIDSSLSKSPAPPRQPTTNNPQPLTLRLFEEEKKLFLLDDETKTYGVAKLAFNRELFNVVVSYDSIGQFTFLEKQKDTLFLWYAAEADAAFNIYVQRDTFIDTIEVASGLKEKFYENAKLQPLGKASSRAPVLFPEDSFELELNHPIFSIDKSLVRLLEDSVKTEIPGNFIIDSINQRKLMIHAEWKEDTLYEAELLPGSITDIFGLQNADTIRRKWISGLKKDYGSMTLRLIDLSPDTAYVIRLLAKNDDLMKKFTVKDSSSFTTHLPYLAPDTYSLEIIEDLDQNGRWTTGNYDLKRQPERVQKTTLEEVRANWEVEAEVGVQFGSLPVQQFDSPQLGGSQSGGQPPRDAGGRSSGGRQ